MEENNGGREKTKEVRNVRRENEYRKEENRCGRNIREGGRR